MINLDIKNMKHVSDAEQPDRISINSTYDNLIFTDDKATLFLPSLDKKRNYKPFGFDSKDIPDYLIDENANPEVDNLDSLAYHYLSNILRDLEKGSYRFAFYAFVNLKSDKYADPNLYLPDEGNKDLDETFSLVKVTSSSGYSKFLDFGFNVNNERYTEDTLLLAEGIQKAMEFIGEQGAGKPTQILFKKESKLILTINKNAVDIIPD